MEDKCVCCGAVIPEGRQVCPNCFSSVEKIENSSVSTSPVGIAHKTKEENHGK